MCAVRKTETAGAEYRRYLDMVSSDGASGVIQRVKGGGLLCLYTSWLLNILRGRFESPNSNCALAENSWQYIILLAIIYLSTTVSFVYIFLSTYLYIIQRLFICIWIFYILFIGSPKKILSIFIYVLFYIFFYLSA